MLVVAFFTVPDHLGHAPLLRLAIAHWVWSTPLLGCTWAFGLGAE